MNKNKIALLLLSTIIASPAVLAETPNFNFVSGGYLNTDIDDELDGDGITLDGSVLVSENVFLSGQYQTVDFSDDGVDLDLNWLSAGIGYRMAVSANTDVYGLATYENIETEASYYGSSLSDDENGYGFTAGVRSLVTSNIELDGQIGYIDIDDSDTFLSAGARYYFNKNFSVGANYKTLDDIDLVSLTARYSF